MNAHTGRANELGVLPVPRRARCELRIDAETAITGHVDVSSGKHDDRTHDVTAEGRDATGDLVDCAAIHKTGQWEGRTVLQIAQDLAKPFGVPVRADVNVGRPLPRFALELAETAFEAIRRACRFRGILPTTDGLGNLVLTRAGARRSETRLVVGRNVDVVSWKHDDKERFSEYIAVSQGLGGDEIFGEDAADQRAIVKDASVGRYRPTMLQVDEEASLGTLKDHATWMRNVAYGKSEEFTVHWTGWKDEQGVLWRPNTIVHFVDEFIGVAGEYCISGVRYTLAEKEYSCEFDIVPRETYDLGPLPVEDE